MMTAGEIKAINAERLGCWGNLLTDVHATPAILVGIGHDRESGRVHLMVPENLPTNLIRSYLQTALASLGQ